LTFSEKGQSNATQIQLGDQTVIFGTQDGKWCDDPKAKSLGNGLDGKERLGKYAVWQPYKPPRKDDNKKVQFRDPWPVTVTQLIEVVRGDTNKLDSCFVGYVLKNDGKTPVDVGVTVWIDTCINGDDGNYFGLPGRDAIKKVGFIKNDDGKPPAYIEAFAKDDTARAFSGVFSPDLES